MNFLEETFNAQHSTLNREPGGRVPVHVIECWALNVECSMFPKILQP